jgi:hypothetical protein
VIFLEHGFSGVAFFWISPLDVIVSLLLPPCVGNLVLAHEFQHGVLRSFVSHMLQLHNLMAVQKKKKALTQFLH